MKNIRKLTDEDKKRLYEKYKDTLLPKHQYIKMLEYHYDDLPEITFVMLAVLEERDKYFSDLVNSHPMKGHGGTPHIIDSSKGRQMKRYTEKFEKRTESAYEKVNEQKEKIYNHTHRVIKRQQAANVRPGSDKATELVQSELQRREKLQELMKTWNKMAKKEETRDQLHELFRQIKETGIDVVIYAEKYGSIYTDEVNKWVDDTSVKSRIASFELTSNLSKVKRLRDKLELCKKADAGKTQEFKDNQNPAIIAMEQDGVITQWKKHPEVYFIKGYRKVAIRTYSKDASKISYPYKYAPSEEQKAEFQKMATEKYGAVFV